uniref:MFS transporter n=1 Tax=Microbulbifer agarilyticus TaxID=260552 RepID=UPI0002559D24|nr:MFS transporter [Microbulbifer agarilyticus]
MNTTTATDTHPGAGQASGGDLATGPARSRKRDVWFYALGDGGSAIPLLTIGNFAMIFYTQALGLPAALAALALGITTLWDAVTDPVMGFVSDNTRSRYGRRHLYMLVGGLATSVSLYSLWSVPEFFMASNALLFTYLLVANLILRTAVTVFVVPFTALGFEICKTYESRASLQSVRMVVNMAINFTFGAMAWSLFFQDGTNADGSRLDGTKILENYETMGLVISLGTAALVLLCCYLTRKFIVDSRNMEMHGNGLKDFFATVWGILKDPHANKIFMFYAVAQVGVGLTAQMQIYTYIDYMGLNAFQKSFVHGSTMVGFTLGSLAIIPLVKRIEKRTLCKLAVLISAVSGVAMYFLFGQTGSLETIAKGGEWAVSISFGVFQGLYWLGCGIIIPLAVSMIADVSEMNFRKTGVLRDGSYSAMFSFILKAATSVGLLVSGFALTLMGYVEGVTKQELEVAQSIANFTFLGGPAIMALSLLFLARYRVDRSEVTNLQQAN